MSLTTIEYTDDDIINDIVKNWQPIIESTLEGSPYTHNQMVDMARYAQYQAYGEMIDDACLNRIKYGIKVLCGIYNQVPGANVLIAPSPVFICIRKDEQVTCETSRYKVAECIEQGVRVQYVIDKTVEFIRMKMRNFNTVAIYMAYAEFSHLDKAQFFIRATFMDPKENPANMYVLNDKNGSYEVEVIDLTVDQVVTTHDAEGNRYHINKSTGQVINAFTYRELQDKVEEIRKQVSALSKSISNITEVVGL